METKLFPPKLTSSQNKVQKIYKNFKKHSTQLDKIHKVWHPVKYYQTFKKAEK